MRVFLIIYINNLACIVNAHLCFVMATVPYLLYIPTRLYLNTTYTVSSTNNGLKNKINRLIQIMIIDTLHTMMINVGADNIIMSGDDN